MTHPIYLIGISIPWELKSLRLAPRLNKEVISFCKPSRPFGPYTFIDCK